MVVDQNKVFSCQKIQLQCSIVGGFLVCHVNFVEFGHLMCR